MSTAFLDHIQQQLVDIESAGLLKSERAIVSAQSGRISVTIDGVQRDDVINLCANNYLGLANHPDLIQAAKGAMDEHG